jgi:6-phosphofructokinase 1
LLARPVEAERLTTAHFPGTFMRISGTVLGTTNKGDPFDFPEADGRTRDRSQEVIDGWRSLEIDALVGIGGDGSLKILRRLAQQGEIALVAVPKTIDNDVGPTEVSIGYPTAVMTATTALDHLQPTAASHSRVMILEVMGRDAGHIALAAGISGGADVILIPEVSYSMAAVAAKLRRMKEDGRNFALVVVAEAVRTEDGRAVRQFQAGGGQRRLWRHRLLHRLAHYRGDGRRDTGHRAGSPAARRHAHTSGPVDGVHLRRSCGRPNRRRSLRPHGRLEWPPSHGRTLGRGHRHQPRR